MFRIPLLSLTLVVGLAWPAFGAEQAHKIKDAESATHGDDAAQYSIVDTYEYDDFEIVQYTLPVLSHYSYILVSDGEALVVDPGRDYQVYQDYLQKNGLAAKGVYLTHSHADFVAGHMEVANALRCPIYKSAKDNAGYEHVAVKEGDVLDVGRAQIKFIETPGHTPDSTCAYVAGKGDTDKPRAIFTGDTLFVGSIGRPDLLEGTMTAAELASMAFDSWHNKLAKAGDDAMIFPAHGAGSLCGAKLRDEPYSTIGTEKASNPYVQHTSRSAFVATILSDLPGAPQYFAHNAALNRKGPELVDWDAPLPDSLEPSRSLIDPAHAYVVDIRSSHDYAAGHIPNSVNIALRGRFESWVGRMVPWAQRLVLFGEKKELREALRRLHRVGYKADVVTVDRYREAGLPLIPTKNVEPRSLYEAMQRGDAPMVVDVRLPNESAGLRIGTVVNLPVTELAERSAKLDPTQPVVTVCNSAYRSSMALGILERAGFTQASTLTGGGEAWINAGLPVYGNKKYETMEASAQQVVRLPDRISADELRRLQMDLPGTFDLVDIRPPEHFADYHVDGAVNVNVAELLNNPAYLTGAGPLIVIDRDGTLAMMVAGILSQKTERTIKVVYGGLDAYWKSSTVAQFRGESTATGGAGGPSKAPVTAPKPTGQPIKKPSKPKRTSAGC